MCLCQHCIKMHYNSKGLFSTICFKSLGKHANNICITYTLGLKYLVPFNQFPLPKLQSQSSHNVFPSRPRLQSPAIKLQAQSCFWCFWVLRFWVFQFVSREVFFVLGFVLWCLVYSSTHIADLWHAWLWLPTGVHWNLEPTALCRHHLAWNLKSHGPLSFEFVSSEALSFQFLELWVLRFWVQWVHCY